MQWFRFYHEFRHDTKMKRMPIPHRYAFVVLLCLASENEPRGVITGLDDEDIAFELEMELEDWQTLKSKFRVKGLIELGPDGTIIIANWDKRQFVSDSSSDRVAAHRERKKKQACNVTASLAKQDVTPSETDTDPNSDSEADSKPLSLDPEGEASKKKASLGVHPQHPPVPDIFARRGMPSVVKVQATFEGPWGVGYTDKLKEFERWLLDTKAKGKTDPSAWIAAVVTGMAKGGSRALWDEFERSTAPTPATPIRKFQTVDTVDDAAEYQRRVWLQQGA